MPTSTLYTLYIIYYMIILYIHYILFITWLYFIYIIYYLLHDYTLYIIYYMIIFIYIIYYILHDYTLYTLYIIYYMIILYIHYILFITWLYIIYYLLHDYTLYTLYIIYYMIILYIHYILFITWLYFIYIIYYLLHDYTLYIIYYMIILYIHYILFITWLYIIYLILHDYTLYTLYIIYYMIIHYILFITWLYFIYIIYYILHDYTLYTLYIIYYMIILYIHYILFITWLYFIYIIYYILHDYTLYTLYTLYILTELIAAGDVWRWDEDHNLQPTQRHWGTRTRPEPKPREEVLLGECGPEGVDECQCVWGPSYTWGHSVEGQRASRPVHIHSYSGGARGGEGEGCSSIGCKRQCNHHYDNKVSRTCCSIQAGCHSPHSSPCDSSVCHSYSNSLLSSPPPSNSGQSDPLYTTPGTRSQISLGGQDETDPLQPSSPPWGPQTERDVCGLCLGPVWVHRHLAGEQDMIRGWRSIPGFPVRSGAPA